MGIMQAHICSSSSARPPSFSSKQIFSYQALSLLSSVSSQHQLQVASLRLPQPGLCLISGHQSLVASLRLCPPVPRGKKAEPLGSRSGLGNSVLTARVRCPDLICSVSSTACPSVRGTTCLLSRSQEQLWRSLGQSWEHTQAAWPFLRIRHLCHCQHFPWAQLELGIGGQQGLTVLN